MSSAMSTCRICSQDLTVELDPESFDEASSSSVGQSTIAPDDLVLQCGCHFHFQCLLDQSPEIATSLTCPACRASILTTSSQDCPDPRVVTRYINEGGLQPSLDILPLIQEEAFLDATPSARPARAFMTMCSEGDISGIVELLQAIGEDPDEGDMEPAQLVRWNDPLDRNKTGLHIAIEKGQIEVVLLLLWIGSSLADQAFPGEFVQGASRMLVARGMLGNGEDVRTLRNGEGKLAGDVARIMGGRWNAFLQAGMLDA